MAKSECPSLILILTLLETDNEIECIIVMQSISTHSLSSQSYLAGHSRRPVWLLSNPCLSLEQHFRGGLDAP